MAKQVLITGTVPTSVLEKLDRQGYELDVRELKALVKEDDLIDALKGKDAHIFGGYELMTAKAIESTNKLQVIAFVGAGYEAFVDVEAASRKGIVVTNTPGGNKQSVAEMTIGLVLAALRRIPFLNERVRAGEWRTADAGRELSGKTLGIVGMGRIGSRVAEIAKFGFDMDILYYSRKRKEAVEERTGARMVPLDELLQHSDIISLHCSYDPEKRVTGGLIGPRQLAQMKPGAVLINTARPEVVDGAALYEALSEGRIAAAAFDGYYTEPEPPTPETDKYGLVSLSSDVFIITSHNAWNTPEANENMFMMAAQSVMDVLNGRPNPHVIKPEVVS